MTSHRRAQPGGLREQRRRRTRIGSSSDWAQLFRFALVGASGYLVNLVVFSALTHFTGAGHLLAGVAAFLVAVSNNFALNRAWTFDASSGPASVQAVRFLTVSLLGLALNLALLEALIRFAEIPEILAQAFAVAVVTPVNFLGNRLWTFRVASRSWP